MRLQGDYNATSWPQLAKPDLAFGQPSWVGAECGNIKQSECNNPCMKRFSQVTHFAMNYSAEDCRWLIKGGICLFMNT